MMSTIDLRGRTPGARELRQLLPRAEFDVAAAVETVRPFGLDVCSGVRTGGRLDAEKLKRFFAHIG